MPDKKKATSVATTIGFATTVPTSITSTATVASTSATTSGATSIGGSIAPLEVWVGSGAWLVPVASCCCAICRTDLANTVSHSSNP